MQQQQPQRRSKHSQHPAHLPGAAPYLRILFPRHIQLREPVPQLLNQPHPDLDAESYHFLALLVRDFIQTWYSSFSSDPQFVASIVNVVIDIARKLERRCQEVDWVGLLLQDVPEVLKRHYMDYRQAAQKLETAYAPNQTIESIFHGLQPHFALKDGEESEKEYLRQIADELLRTLLPSSEYESDCVRWLVREILCCLVLRSLVEILTEPDMINYIVNTLLTDFEPTDDQYEAFLRKAADKMDTSDENFTTFLASLGKSKGGAQGTITRRSSTPNIQTTDEMVNMLQEAQASVLESLQPGSERPSPAQHKKRMQKSSLARPERNDGLLSQRISGAADDGDMESSNSRSMNKRESYSPLYVSSLEPPLQIPLDIKSSKEKDSVFERTRTADGSTATRPSFTGNNDTTGFSRFNQPQSDPTLMSKIRSSTIWAVTEAPPKYTSYMIDNVFVPFGAFLVAFLNFMVIMPNRISQVSQSMAWIYAELDAPDHTDLEVGILRMAKEIFYLEERNPVIWRQWEIMGWPLIRTLGGGAIDRLLAHGVYWIFAEPRLVMYLQAGRRALWPDPNSSPPRPRGVDEMEKARKEAERRILRTIPAPLRDTFFGEDGVHHLLAAQEALEPFQNKACNKHLMYIALDLLLSKVVPEIYPERP
ncbi:PXA domain-containing protein [Dissophora ornata]|nr:hypothetical protein BGZ58_009543 [Dissophora ornata]KAI8599873.1 PXA domain-containing protein [Dissophora ornata]